MSSLHRYCENLTKVLPEVDFLFHEGNPEGLEEMIMKKLAHARKLSLT